MKLSRDILQIHSAFESAGFKLYPVGGAVRDFLLGIEPKDIDLATDALPGQIIELLSDYNLTENDLQGKNFGVVRVRTRYFPDGIEIATFREDITTGRNPEVRVGATIEEDVNRRDLTINALFYDIKEKKVIDFVGGVNDLEHKRIMTPGNPLDRFNEDGLRVIRALRFAARIGGWLDPTMRAAIASKNPKLESIKSDGTLERVAPERIWDEFQTGLKQAINPHDFVISLVEHDIMREVFPGFIQTNSVVLDSRKPEIVVAGLMLGRFSESQTVSGRRSLVKYLKDCKLTDKQARGVVALMRLVAQSADEVYEIYRTLVQTGVTFADGAALLRELGHGGAFADALSLYSPTIKSEDLQAEGFFDAELGAEMKRRETELFNNLINNK